MGIAECESGYMRAWVWDPSGRPATPGGSMEHGPSTDDFKALIAILDACQGSVVLSGYAACLPHIPASWEVQTIETYCSANAKGVTAGHDRTRSATADEMGDRTRTEYLWRVDRSASMRQDLQALFRPKAPINLSLDFDGEPSPTLVDHC